MVLKRLLLLLLLLLLFILYISSYLAYKGVLRILYIG
jgi:hypothetical protein